MNLEIKEKAVEPAARPDCRSACEFRLQECYLGVAGKEECRREWRYCVYDCFAG